MERQLLLLGLLRREDMHGYRLNEFIERDLAFCTDVKKPTAYYLLDKLAEQGYISEVEGTTEADSNRPPRITYHITPAGETHFMELLRDNLSHFERHTFPGDIGIAFMDALPAGEAVQRLQARRQAMQAFLAEMEQVPAHQGPLNLVVDHHVRHMRAEIDWLDGVLDWLESATDIEEESSSRD